MSEYYEVLVTIEDNDLIDVTISEADQIDVILEGLLAVGPQGVTGIQGMTGPGLSTFDLPFIIDGNGSAIIPGIVGDLIINNDLTILGWTVLANQVGSIVIDIWKDSYTNYPPTVDDSMPGVSGNKPTISSDVKGQALTLTNWSSVLLSAGDTLRFNVDSCTDITRVTVMLKVSF